MKKKWTLLVVAVTAFVAVCAAACKNTGTLSGYVSAMESSSKQCASVEAVIEVKDGEELVYSLSRRIEKSGKEYTVTQTEKQLDASFTLSENTEVQTLTSIEKKALLPVSLGGDVMTEYNIQSGTLTGVISSREAMEKAFDAGQFSLEGNAAVECKMTGKKISSIDIGYKTAGGRSVGIAVRYGY